jgi:hypothetical protein
MYIHPGLDPGTKIKYFFLPAALFMERELRKLTKCMRSAKDSTC